MQACSQNSYLVKVKETMMTSDHDCNNDDDDHHSQSPTI